MAMTRQNVVSINHNDEMRPEFTIRWTNVNKENWLDLHEDNIPTTVGWLPYGSYEGGFKYTRTNIFDWPLHSSIVLPYIQFSTYFSPWTGWSNMNALTIQARRDAHPIIWLPTLHSTLLSHVFYHILSL